MNVLSCVNELWNDVEWILNIFRSRQNEKCGRLKRRERTAGDRQTRSRTPHRSLIPNVKNSSAQAQSRLLGIEILRNFSSRNPVCGRINYTRTINYTRAVLYIFFVGFYPKHLNAIRSTNIIADFACKLLPIVWPETLPVYWQHSLKHSVKTAIKIDLDFSLGDRWDGLTPAAWHAEVFWLLHAAHISVMRKPSIANSHRRDIKSWDSRNCELLPFLNLNYGHISTHEPHDHFLMSLLGSDMWKSSSNLRVMATVSSARVYMIIHSAKYSITAFFEVNGWQL
jgi:hypothetical protein